MTTATRNKTLVIWGMIALSVLIIVVDLVTPVGAPTSIFFVAVVGANMWLPGLRPIFVAALSCTVLTALTFFLEFLPRPLDIDLVNRGYAIATIWVVAFLCALYKRAEQRAQELAAIVESSEDAIFTRTPDGVITSWNAGAQRLFGYAAKEILGRSGSILLPPDRLDEQSRILDAIKRGERVANFETVRVRRDGRQVPVFLSASPVADTGGKVVGVASIASDITERKRTAEELQQRGQKSAEAEERMRSVVNHVADGIITIDDHGSVTTFNPAAERIFGYAAHEVVGQNIKMLMPEPYHTQHDGYVSDYVRTGQAKIIGIGREVVGRRKDGVTFPLDLAISTFRLGQGRYFTGIVRDITERKRAAEALRESEERFRGTFENAAVGIAHVDADGRFLLVNKKLCDIVGYTREELLVRGFQDITHPEDLAASLENFHSLIRGELPGFSLEKRYLRKDRSVVWGNVSLSIQNRSAGEPAYGIAILQDISEVKKVEDELRRASERLELALRSSNIALGEMDLTAGPNRRPEWLNYWEQWGTGNPEDYPTHKSMMGLLHPEDRDEVARDTEAFVSGEVEEFKSVHRVQHRDGSYHWALAQGVLFRDAQGRPIRSSGSVIDINELKRAEENLRESEERFRGTFENAAVGIAHEDLNGRFLRFNKRFCAILGYPPEELVGKTLTEVTRPEDLAVDLAKFEALKRGESSSYTMEKRFIRKDGTLIWADVTVALQVEATGKPTYCIKVIQDISDRKTLEEELQRAMEAADAASRAKSEFLASMSHEIRTPMNGVFGMLDLALDTELQPEQRHYLEQARSSADLLMRVINDILDFSKIEAGRLDLEPAPFSLRENLGEAIKAFGPRAHRKGLELALHVQSDTPDGVVGDAMRLGQVLTNLLGNAIKFTDRGEVVLEARAESVIEGQVCLHLAVTDTGPGIPPDKQQLIFSAFAQADSSMARRFGGTGLGLAISTRLVELMGGRIWVESEVGKGSTFHFTACFGQHHEPVARPQAKRIDLEGLPVLVVDDNETNRGILGEMLANWGMMPTNVGGGRAALAEMKRAAAASDPFTLVLLDAVMPDMDGFAVAQEIKNDPALAGATIMMLTSADRGGELARCRELGIAAYLRKPVKQSELLNAILTALGRLAEPETAPARPGVSPPGARSGLRILVAEDNELNQELAVNLLKKWGHVAVLVGDGKAALAAWEREPFDLILMDVQMPDMDGLAATQAIRANESAMNTHVPIIALTAHAMKGDRERCLAAGMDAYASKPIRAAELAEAIARLLPAEGAGAQGTAVPEGPPGAVFDLDTALAVVAGDRELLRRMIHVFSGQCPKLLGEIRDSVQRGDGAALERAAHKFKASLGSVGGQRASEVAVRLEELGGAGDVTGSQHAYPELEEEVRHLQAALADLVRERGTAGP